MPSDFERALAGGKPDKKSSFEKALEGSEPGQAPAGESGFEQALAGEPKPAAGLEALKESFQRGLIGPVGDFLTGEVIPRAEAALGGHSEALGPLTAEQRRLPMVQGAQLKALGEKQKALESLRGRSKYLATDADEKYDTLGELNKLLRERADVTRTAGPVEPPKRPGVPGAVASGLDALLGSIPRGITGALVGTQEALRDVVSGKGLGEITNPLKKAGEYALKSFAEDPAERPSSQELFTNVTKAALGDPSPEALAEWRMRNPGAELAERLAGIGTDFFLGAAIPPYGKARPGFLAPHKIAAEQVGKALGKQVAANLGKDRILAASREAFNQFRTPIQQVKDIAGRLGLDEDSAAALVEAFGPGAAGLGKLGIARKASEFLAKNPEYGEVAGGLKYGADWEPGAVDLVRAPMAAKGRATSEAGDVYAAMEKAIPNPVVREALGKNMEIRQGVAESAQRLKAAEAAELAGDFDRAAKLRADSEGFAARARTAQADLGLEPTSPWLKGEGEPFLYPAGTELHAPGTELKFVMEKYGDGLVLPTPSNLTTPERHAYDAARTTLDDFAKQANQAGLRHNVVDQYMPEYFRHKAMQEVSLDTGLYGPGKEAFRKAKDAGHTGGSKVYDIAEFMALRHRAQSMAMANLDLETRVMQAFGKSVDEVSKRGLEGTHVVYTGKLGANAGKKVVMDKRTYEMLRNMISPEAAEKAWKVADELLSDWKALVTVGKGPGFAMRNQISNMLNMVASGVDIQWVGKMMAADAKFGGQTAFGPVGGLFTRGLRKVSGWGGGSFKVAGMSPEEVIRLAEREGLIEAGYYATEIGRVGKRSLWSNPFNPLSKEFLPARLTGELNEYFERTSKLAVFADRLAKGWTPGEAAKFAADTIFSMREVPAGVAKLGAVSPFIRWTWKQWGFNIMKLVSDPKVMYRYGKVLEGMQRVGDNAETAKLRRLMDPAVSMGLLTIPDEFAGNPALRSIFLQGYSGLSNLEFFNPAHIGENAMRMLHPVINVLASLARSQKEEGDVRTQSGTMPYVYRKKVKPYTFVTDAMEWARKNNKELWLKVVKSGFITPTQPGRIGYVDKLTGEGESDKVANARALVELPVLEYRWDAEVPQYLYWVAPQLSNALGLFKPKDEAVYEALMNAIAGIKTRIVTKSEALRQKTYADKQQAKPLREAGKEIETGY